MTLNRAQLISDVIRLCGGVNIFATHQLPVPTVDPEAVIQGRPDVIVTSTSSGRADDSIALWKSLPRFGPVEHQALVVLASDLITRPTPRILLGARQLCEAFDLVRAGQPVPLP